MTDVLNVFGQNVYDRPVILMRLSSKGLDDPNGMAKVQFLDVALVPVGLTELSQSVPADLGRPSAHVEPFTERRLLLRIELGGCEISAARRATRQISAWHSTHDRLRK